MIEFALWLVTSDKDITDKWYRLFSRERFNIRLRPGLPAVGAIPPDTWGLALVETGTQGLTSPPDLKTFLGGRKNISVIIFSGPGKTSASDISGFLDQGADDFILSDIDERVLLSRVKAHLRRLLPSLNLARTAVTSGDGGIELDKVKRTVRLGPAAGKNRILGGLTPKEFEILFVLVGSEGRAVSRKTLMENIWRGKSGCVNTETIDKHVETLRRKLGTYGKKIGTVYGTGYVYKTRPEEPL